MSTEHLEIWNNRKLAHFLNTSYEHVSNMPLDDKIRASYLAEIESLTHTEEGIEILKNNIRYMQTEPEIDSLRKKYGKE